MPRLIIKYAILAILLALCAVPALRDLTRSATRDDVVTLRFWNGFTGPDGTAMLGIVKRFNEANPDIHVVMQRMPWATYYNKLFVAGLGDRAPEVFVLHMSSITRFLRAHMVRSVDDLTGTGPGLIDAADIDPNVWQAVSSDGKHWGIPLDCHMLGMYYNKTLLKNAGIVDAQGNPKPPTTREEFLEDLRKLKHPAHDGMPAQWGFVYTWQRTNVYAIMRQFGGGFYDQAADQLTMNSLENTAALYFASSIVREGLAPSPENFDAWVGFLQGNVAMCFEGIYMLPDLQRQKGNLDYGAAPIPELGLIKATWADSHDLCLRPDLAGKDLEAARRFIKFLSDNSLDWAQGGQVPVRRSLRKTERFQKMDAQREFAKQIPYACYFPPVPYLLELLPEFDYSIELALRNKVSAQKSLDECAARLKPIYARYHQIGDDQQGGSP